MVMLLLPRVSHLPCQRPNPVLTIHEEIMGKPRQLLAS